LALALAVVLFVGYLVLRPMGRIVRSELRFDWTIAMLAWHAFALGAVLGAFAVLIAGLHWHFMHLG
jgi:uncharacterized membrane protein YoaK (UPF0700 family)